MAFTREQIEDFIAALHEDAELRERVRGAILADDFQALPGLVRANTEAIAALTERMDALTERMDALTEHMDALTERIDAFIAAYNQTAQPFAWTKKKVYQRRFKNRRITQL